MKVFHLRLLVVLMLLLLPIVVVGQKELSTKNRSAIKLYEEARNYFGMGKNNEAYELLIKAIAKEPDFIEPYLVIADLFHQKGEYDKEIDFLRRSVAIDSTFFPLSFYNIGVAAYNLADYEEALTWFDRYKWRFANEHSMPRVNDWLRRTRFAMEAMSNRYNIDLYSAGDGVNDDLDAYWPSLTADEKYMVFTVLVPRDYQLFKEKELPKSALYFQEDFYISERGDSLWLPRKKLEGSINTPGNEGAQSLSADGNWLFFTACGRPDGRGSCDIYFSQKEGSVWSDPVNLGMPVNTPYWESQPTFSSDGRTIMFVSNRPGGVGGKDIWRATIQRFTDDGTPVFGDLRCLGKNINTEKDESSPFLHQDNQTLYFSSNGRAGMGASDIYLSRKKSTGEWDIPLHLGVPINTPGDEVGFVVNASGDKGYLASDGRESDSKNKRIYWLNLPEPLRPQPVTYVKGRVFDAETGATLPAEFELNDLKTGVNIVSSKSNQKSGDFLVCLPLGGRFAFRASHPGYLFYSGHFDIGRAHPLDQPYYLDIPLNPVHRGAMMTLENIFFELNSYSLRGESTSELEGLLEFLSTNPDVKIMIGGHTDNQGRADYNQRLSENRAKAVYQYLVDKGVDASRLKYMGFGMNQPVADNETEEGRAKNRRTEITVL
ncbi:OmpA family protein [Geofilum sp. OHC36d9]|uniref:OmpA family protein n=1 Tax=Geofilum sp. OHC36d9 TaxID=3458413 RepID=UPI004034F450